MARRFFLHIGTPKSATSYIQDLCRVNSRALAAQGVRWIEGDRYAPLRDLLDRRRLATDTDAWASFVAQLRDYDGDLLFSSETLVTLDDRELRRFVQALPDSELRIIITARDLARTIPSQWQTTLKHGGTTGWSTYADVVCSEDDAELSPTGAPGRRERAKLQRLRTAFWLKHDLSAIIARWTAAAPVEAFTLVTVPADSADRTSTKIRFGASLGLDFSEFAEPAGSGNSSIGAWSAELLRRLNGELVDVDRDTRKVGIRDVLGKEVLAALADGEPSFALSPDQHEWAHERASRMVRELRAVHVPVQGDLDDLLPRASMGSRVDPAATTDTELLRVAMKGLVGMARSITALSRDDAPVRTR